MTAEERIAALEQENRYLRVKLAEAYQQIAHLVERFEGVAGKLAKDSYNSNKPPSSDALGRKIHQQRQRSEKKPGGQTGHPGQTLLQVAHPDEVVSHRPENCSHCQQPLAAVPGWVKERRQVHDLPEVRLLIREHQAEAGRCPSLGDADRGSRSKGVPLL